MTREQQRRLTLRVRTALHCLSQRQIADALAEVAIPRSARLGHPAAVLASLQRRDQLQAGLSALEAKATQNGEHGRRSHRPVGSGAGSNLRAVRESGDRTQRELAAYLGVDCSMIARLEAGERLPSLILANRIEALLDIPAIAWHDSAELVSPAVQAKPGASPADWESREIERALRGDPMLRHTRRLLAEHGPLGRPLHPEHSQAESEARARAREERDLIGTEENDRTDLKLTAAESLRRARELLGWETGRMAQHLNLDRTLLAKIEARRRKPTLPQACRIQIALGIPTRDWSHPADLLPQNGSAAEAA